MKLRTVTPPLVAQRFGTALRRRPRASPHDFDFVALKVCVFLTNCGLHFFLREFAARRLVEDGMNVRVGVRANSMCGR
jgi:hypothetical protein